MNHTTYFEEYTRNIELIKDSEKTAYTLKLFFANVITLMEVYLSQALISTLRSDRGLMVKVTESKLFKTVKIPLKTAFTSDIEQYIISQINQMVFHKLNDVFILYRDILGIEFRQNRRIVDSIKIRHHIVHRNGTDFDGNPIEISKNDLENVIDVITDFLSGIDAKLHEQFSS
jgi:hypothetical protein